MNGNEKKYSILMRTSTAEIRSWNELYKTTKDSVLPIFELTRGNFKRGAKEKLGDQSNNLDIRITYPDIFEIDKNIDFLKNVTSNKHSLLDVTKNKYLQSYESNKIYSYTKEEGFFKWINFLKDLGNKENIYPVLQGGEFDFEENNEEDLGIYINSYQEQFNFISKNYKGVAYRIYIRSIKIDNYLTELAIIAENIKKYLQQDDKNRFYLLIDYGDLPLDVEYSYNLLKDTKIIEGILKISSRINIAILSNSYVKFDNEKEPYKILEIDLFKKIIEHYKVWRHIFIYGDYASISKIRNDDIVMARGWIPKVEFIVDKKIYMIKQKRGKDDYETAYKKIGEKIKSEYKDYYKKIADSWGKNIIDKLTEGDVVKKNPGFYISVRSNIFISYIVSELEDIYRL
jgi:hypothetical protein